MYVLVMHFTMCACVEMHACISSCVDSECLVCTTIARAAMHREEAVDWLIISVREKLCFREVLTLKAACTLQIN